MSLETFAERKALGDEWEAEVFELVKNTPGWHVQPFGQAMLQEATRKLIRKVDTPMRWMPDFLASRIRDGKSFLLEAKWTDTEEHRSNYDIEVKSVEAMLKHGKDNGIPVYFVFPDFWVAEAREIASIATRGTFRGNGSGKPFYLVPQYRCKMKLQTLLMQP